MPYLRKKRIRRSKKKKYIKHGRHTFSFCLCGTGGVTMCVTCLGRSGRTKLRQQHRKSKKDGTSINPYGMYNNCLKSCPKCKGRNNEWQCKNKDSVNFA